MPNPGTRRPIAERYWALVDVREGCWGWKGYKQGAGYGRICRGGHSGGFTYAHRVSWEIHHGAIPDGLFVLHKCDNPECSNPEHLFLGDDAANHDDKARKNRGWVKLTPQQVVEIRERLAAGESAKSLARSFGVSDTMIGFIKHRRQRRYAENACPMQ